ncbi:uncharacterized protein LOC127720664 [Mytilus californianus]|uniref:uncharacterized protein LOC127720664 n=1 Tax=Mytilus californianus TaxID=6549 RepID=UPI0022483127|nr:uncharacterized protein LOC127720664 [Mytilus californianus]
MVLFGYVDDDQAPDQVENINTDKERGCKTKVQSDKEDDSETCCQRRQIENEMDGEDSEVSMTDKAREKCIYFKQEKNNLMQEQEPNIQSGLSVRLMGFFRKKSRSSKREQKSKEKDRKEQEPKIEGGLFARLMGFFGKKSRSSKREQKSKEKDMKGKFKSKDSGSRPFMDVFLCCGLK